MSLLNQAMQGVAVGFVFSLTLGLMNGLSTRIFPSGKSLEEITNERFASAVNGGGQ